MVSRAGALAGYLLTAPPGRAFTVYAEVPFALCTTVPLALCTTVGLALCTTVGDLKVAVLELLGGPRAGALAG